MDLVSWRTEPETFLVLSHFSWDENLMVNFLFIVWLLFFSSYIDPSRVEKEEKCYVRKNEFENIYIDEGIGQLLCYLVWSSCS